MASNLGIKGSPSGYDVTDLQDYLQTFNSSWPHLKISQTGVFSSDISHGLGYPPFYIMCSSAADFGADGRVYQFAGNYFGVNSTTLTRFSGSSTPRYFIFRLDLTQNYTAEIISGSTTSGTRDTDFGFKLTKDGKDISSTDMRDFSLHSGTTAPLVHSVTHGTMTNTGGGLGWEFNAPHSLGYIPTAFAFLKPSTNSLSLPTDKYGYVMGPVGVSGRYYTSSSSNIYVTADSTSFTAEPTVSVVILKNPFTLETVSRTFP